MITFEQFQKTRAWHDDLAKATGYTIADEGDGEAVAGFGYDKNTLYIIANGGGAAPALYTLHLDCDTYTDANLERLEQRLYQYGVKYAFWAPVEGVRY